MRIAVVGAGAIGGLLGARLAGAGEEVTLVDRGAHAEAMRRDGLRLVEVDGAESVIRPAAVTERIETAGAQDLVVLALKAHALPGVAAELPGLLGPETALLTVQNGIPWWYFHKHPGPLAGRRLRCLDPDGLLARHVDADRVIGCVAYPAAAVEAPGVVRHVEGDRLPVGELDGSETPRVRAVSQALERAGFRSRIVDAIRAEIWLKAWGNLCFNPISALTHSTLEQICRFPDTRALAARTMEEAQAIAHALGIRFRHSVEKRIAGAEAVGAHKTSMLQDAEAGRPLELEALVGSILELGELVGVEAPVLRAVYALAGLLNQRIAEDGVSVAAAKRA